ncbi:FG-GAP repeat domain-containing protein [Litorilituus sediminis]|uniref:VCBS repeat-containing protein n=1 Tax=Litorilituus sediminis TaxID=718192 RepID=A0A4V0ZG52_9GAMM|nr:VCBS repeat-containing protein [Litorilituus sediminis]QBG36090.1 VCBS repeat-containing protein [Litorilituus sediminis]
MKNSVSYFLMVFLLLGCGGGSSDDSSNDGGSTPTPPTDPVQSSSKLPLYDGFELITDITSDDLNNDGFKDLILSRTPSMYGEARIQVLINNQDDTFTDETSNYFSVLENTWFQWIDKLYLADLNNDGLLDIVSHLDQSHWNESIGFQNATEMPLLIATENGQFQPMPWEQLNSVGSFIPLDFDNDGDIDLMSHRFINFGTAEQQIHWSIYRNELIETGDFNFTLLDNSVATLKGADNAAFIYSPIVVDLNSDGFSDIFYGGSKWKNGGFIDELSPFVVLLNTKDGTFIEGTNEVIATTEQLTHAREALSADFNGDQLNDIVITSHGYDGGDFAGERNLLLLASDATTLNVNDSKQSVFDYNGFTHSSDIGDIDNDGDLDIVFSDITGTDVSHGGNIQVFINDGEANFQRKSTAFKTADNGDMFIVSTKLVDLNNDGYLDLVLGGDDAKSSGVVLWNDGTGNF